MSVLYCTRPGKYSTVIADEYRKVTEKIDVWRADYKIYNMYTGSEYGYAHIAYTLGIS